MQHQDFTPKRHFLINKEQQQVCDYIIEKLEANIKECKFSDYSQTCIPQYDTALHRDKKKYLQLVKMSPLCTAKVATLNQQTLINNQSNKQQVTELKSSNLLAYRPEKDQDSKLLNELQISALCGIMPGLYKIAQWNLLYRMSEHGVSMNTFYKRVGGASASLVIMEDQYHHKFGAMVHENWEQNTRFYGTSETFVFTFRNTDQIQHWDATGKNEMYQFSDYKCIGFGGGTDHGRFALYLGDNMYRGNSITTECFNNDVLSNKPEFLCLEMEVWGFE
jgi:hypothetical protein